MKFERALKAMRRGETVRRKGWGSVTYWLEDGKVRARSCDGTPSDGGAFYMHHIIEQNDWVIVRKKKKLRDVFKDPKVGDVIENTGDPSWVMVVLGVSNETVTYWESRPREMGDQPRDEWEADRAFYKVLRRADAMKEMR